MDAEPVLRVISETRQTWEDPSEDLLFMLLEDLQDGRGSYLIVERTADSTGQTYAQTLRHGDGSYTVEHREGDPARHFGTVATDMRAAHELLTGWAFQLEGWCERADWSRVHF